MQPVESFKAISYQVLIQIPFFGGIQPADMIIIFFIGVVLNLFAPFWITIILLVSAFILSKKGAKRPQGYFTSLFMFIRTPPLAAIDYYGDGPSYRECRLAAHSDKKNDEK